MDASIEVARRFGENLRRVRKEAGVSQEALGDTAGMHRTAIGLLERGTSVPRADTVIKLAAALNLPLDCPLLEGIGWKPGTTEAGAFEVSGAPEREGRSDA